MRRREFLQGIGAIAARRRFRPELWATGTALSANLLAVTPALAQSKQQLSIEVLPQLWGSGAITAAAFSPDDLLIAFGCSDGTIALCDAGSGQLLRNLRLRGLPSCVVFSPDGKQILAAGDTIKRWDPRTGRLLQEIRAHPGPISSAAYSPDGRKFASGAIGDGAKLWDAATGRLVRTFERFARSGDDDNRMMAYDLAFSPDGSHLIASVGLVLKLWNVATGKLVHIVQGHSAETMAVAFSPTGKRILSSSEDKTVKLWDLATGKALFTFEGHEEPIVLASLGEGAQFLRARSIAFSPDGSKVLTCNKDTVKVWDAEQGRLLQTLVGETLDGGAVTSTAFSHDGSRILIAGDRQTATLWEAASGRELRRLRSADVDPAYYCCISPDGTRLVSGGDNSPKLWDLTTGRLTEVLTGHTGPITALTFSPDGRLIVSVGSEAIVWDASSGTAKHTLPEMAGCTAAAFWAGGSQLLTASYEGCRVWDIESAQVLRSFAWEGYGGPTAAFAPDGSRVVAGGGGLTAHLEYWDTGNGRMIRSFGSPGYLGGLAVSWDGARVLSGDQGGSVELWDATSGRRIHNFSGPPGWARALAFSRDGTRVISVGDDLIAKLRDAVSGRLIRSFDAGPAHTFTFSPNGRRLVGAGGGIASIWNADTGELVAKLIAAADGRWLSITPEGFFAASDGGAELLTVTKGFEIFSIDQFYQQLYRPDVVRQKLSWDRSVQERVKVAAGNTNLHAILESRAPPDLAILSPATDTHIGEGSITVRATLSDRGPGRGGGIGRVEWRVNGIVRAVDDLQRPSDGAATIVSRELVLPEGLSEISLVAYNKANVTASVPASVLVKVKLLVPRAKPRLHVLAIGLNKYRDRTIPQLNYSVADAKSVAEAFALYGADKTFYDDVVIHGPVLDDLVTRQNLEREVARLGKLIAPEDVFLLYLAGHGVTDDGRYYFLPHEAKFERGVLKKTTAIEQEQWQKWLTSIPAFKSVVLYDTCESGSNTEERPYRGTRQLAAAEKLSRSMGHTVMAATSDVEYAMEGYRYHGAFTYVLLDAIAFADANQDGAITTRELADYLRHHLPVLSERQFKVRQDPQVRLSGAPFTFVRPANIGDIEKVR